MMGDGKRTRYLGALVVVCALGAFAGTAVADSSTPATGTETQETVAGPASNNTESVPAANEGADSGVAPATTGSTEGGGSPGETTTSEAVTTTNESGGTGGCDPEGLVIGAKLAVGSTSATATFSVRNGCEGVLVSLASYTMPRAQWSFPQPQFAASSGIFGAGGPYTLTVALPP